MLPNEARRARIDRAPEDDQGPWPEVRGDLVDAVLEGRHRRPQELVDRRWTAGRILTLDGHPHRGQPIMLTEFGGIALARKAEADATPANASASAPAVATWGYSSARDTDELALMFERLLETVVHTALFSVPPASWDWVAPAHPARDARPLARRPRPRPAPPRNFTRSR